MKIIKRQRKILLFFTVIIALSACGESQSQKSINASDERNQTQNIKIDIETENRYAYIKDHFERGVVKYLKVDYVDYLTGKEATDAEWRDKAYFIDGEDTITTITDGFYISNINPKIRTFRIDENTQIENVIYGNEPHEMEEKKPLNSEQLDEYMNSETLIFLHIKEGIIESIDEQYMP